MVFLQWLILQRLSVINHLRLRIKSSPQGIQKHQGTYTCEFYTQYVKCIVHMYMHVFTNRMKMFSPKTTTHSRKSATTHSNADKK